MLQSEPTVGVRSTSTVKVDFSGVGTTFKVYSLSNSQGASMMLVTVVTWQSITNPERDSFWEWTEFSLEGKKAGRVASSSLINSASGAYVSSRDEAQR